ncbi:MAG: NUDIX hydrolase [Planctomycetes bacterium]|nr:NUDIX hydrolase [Planctomycetota bacterium]
MSGDDEVLVARVELVEDRTAHSRCDEGFLRLRRLVLRNTFTDGTVSPPYPCDVVSRRRVDAVAVVLWHRDPATGRVLVHYREGTRPPVWLRRQKTDDLPLADRFAYDRLGEIVAGVLEVDDVGEEGLRRRGALEAKEEAGYDVDPAAVRPLGDGFFPSPGVTDEKVYLLAAEVDPATRGRAEGDGSVQELGTRMVTRELRDAIRACRAGEVADAKTELGLLRLADQLGYLPQLDCWVSDLPPELRARHDPLV